MFAESPNPKADQASADPISAKLGNQENIEH